MVQYDYTVYTYIFVLFLNLQYIRVTYIFSFCFWLTEHCTSVTQREGHADGWLLVYSISDRESYKAASTALSKVWSLGHVTQRSVILVANKTDLERTRVVSTAGEEGGHGSSVVLLATQGPFVLTEFLRSPSLYTVRMCGAVLQWYLVVICVCVFFMKWCIYFWKTFTLLNNILIRLYWLNGHKTKQKILQG